MASDRTGLLPVAFGVMLRRMAVAPNASALETGRWPENLRVYTLAEELPPGEVAELDDLVEVDAESYLRYLETGEGTDPCEVAFSK